VGEGKEVFSTDFRKKKPKSNLMEILPGGEELYLADVLTCR
jgi:hypothetical protein